MAESNVTPSFSDGRVIVVRADDSADCATFWDESQAGCEQTAEGPTHLVIGTHARDSAINRMAVRFGIPAADLVAFRDGTEQAPESLAERFTQGEAPTFHVVRRCRDVRLWKSTTKEHTSFGQVRHAAEHFHITRGAEIVLNHTPESLAERFTQGEAPTFQVVRRCGDVRLWKSTTKEHTSFGQVRHAADHFHITRAAEIVLNHMPELYEHALPNFNAVSQKHA